MNKKTYFILYEYFENKWDASFLILLPSIVLEEYFYEFGRFPAGQALRSNLLQEAGKRISTAILNANFLINAYLYLLTKFLYQMLRYDFVQQ